MQLSKIFIDTNTLIYHTFENFDNEKHLLAKKFFNNYQDKSDKLFISTQILKEFYAIATNPKIFDTPLSVKEALMKLDEFQNYFFVLNDNNILRLKFLLKKYNIIKQKIHDTNLVAAMIENNIKFIFTFNDKDFKIFNEIEIVKKD